MNKIIQLHGDKEKFVYEPLFNNYVFIYTTEIQLAEIKNTEGIKSFMYWLGEPAVINTAEINMLKHIINEHQNLSLEKIAVSILNQIEVNELTNAENLHQPEAGNKFLKVSLPSLGYAVVAQIRSPEGKIINLQSVETNKTRRAII